MSPGYGRGFVISGGHVFTRRIKNWVLRWRERQLHPLVKVELPPDADVLKKTDELTKRVLLTDIPPRPWRPSLSERDLLDDDERALFEQITPAAPEKVVAYPPPAEQTTQDWVTEELMRRTGGMTRHPGDRTDYPTPPTEVDLAAKRWAGPQRMQFTHGYSMRYLGELKRRAERKDKTLRTEDLMALRARGLC